MATLNLEYTFDHNAEKVCAFAHTEDCFRLRMHEQGAKNITVESSQNNKTLYHFEAERELPPIIPKLIRAKLGKHTMVKVKHAEQWEKEGSENYSCKIESNVEQFKIKIKSHSSYVNHGDTTRWKMTMDISCGIPLVGKKLALLVAKDNKRIMDQEHRLLIDALQQA